MAATLGYPFDTYIPLSSSNAKSNTRYIFREEDGFISEDLMSSELLTLSAQNIYISSDLLLAIQNIQSMQKSHWVELRSFLDRVLSQLAPRTIKARKLLSL